MPSASGSKPSPAASPVSRRSGSTFTSTSRCCSASPFQSLSAQSAIPASRSTAPRVIRLLEVLLHGGSQVGGWTAKHIHHAVFTTFHLSDTTYRLNQLCYDLRKLKAHGLLQRDGSCYAYRL